MMSRPLCLMTNRWDPENKARTTYAFRPNWDEGYGGLGAAFAADCTDIDCSTNVLSYEYIHQNDSLDSWELKYNLTDPATSKLFRADVTSSTIAATMTGDAARVSTLVSAPLHWKIHSRRKSSSSKDWTGIDASLTVTECDAPPFFNSTTEFSYLGTLYNQLIPEVCFLDAIERKDYYYGPNDESPGASDQSPSTATSGMLWKFLLCVVTIIVPIVAAVVHNYRRKTPSRATGRSTNLPKQRRESLSSIGVEDEGITLL